jgi:hypothetical protein
MSDLKQFENKVKEISNEIIKEVDPKKIQAQIKNQVTDALSVAAVTALGFEYDRWDRQFKVPKNSYRPSELFRKAKEIAEKKAQELMDEIDLSSVTLSAADKKAIIAAYKKARREKLEDRARELAYADASQMIDDVFKEIKQDLEKSTKDQDQKELIDAVFGESDYEDEDDDEA